MRSRVSSPPDSTPTFFSQVFWGKPMPPSTFLMFTSML